MEANAEAVEIFFITRGQLIMGPERAIDIMHEPIHRLIDMYEVKNKKECFEKVLIMANAWLNRMGENNGN